MQNQNRPSKIQTTRGQLRTDILNALSTMADIPDRHRSICRSAKQLGTKQRKLVGRTDTARVDLDCQTKASKIEPDRSPQNGPLPPAKRLGGRDRTLTRIFGDGRCSNHKDQAENNLPFLKKQLTGASAKTG